MELFETLTYTVRETQKEGSIKKEREEEIENRETE